MPPRDPLKIPPFLRATNRKAPAVTPAPIYNDDGDAMDIDATERVQGVRAYCGQPGTPLAALPCGYRLIQVRRARKWVYVTCNGKRTRTRRTPAVDAWLDKLGVGASGTLPETDPD